MIETRPATQADLDFVHLNPLDDQIKFCPQSLLAGKAITALRNGIIFSVGGLFPIHKEMAEAWIAFRKEVLDFKIEALWILRDEMEKMIAESDYNRIQATIRTDYPKAIEMIEFFGFKNDTPNGLKSYFPDGKDAYIYSRIKGEQ
jgi:hypothetical protein